MYWLDNPDPRFKRSKGRARRKNQKIEDECGWRQLIIPLGRFGGLAHYACITDHSAHVCCFGKSEDGRRIAGCECMGGLGEKYCYHVDEAYPHHILYAMLERLSPRAAESIARQGQDSLRQLLRLMLHATGADGARAFSFATGNGERAA